MATYCSTGEKAYLTIVGDNSSPYIFDGPITVENRQKQGETTYPANLGSVIVRYWILYPPSADGSRFESFVGTYTVHDFRSAFTVVTQQPNPANSANPLGIFYLALQTNSQQSIRVAGRRFITTTATNNFTALVPESESYYVGFSSRIEVSQGGIVVQPITIPGGYELVVNGSTIKTSLNPIQYTVRCDNPCPEGQVWDELCQACVCENLPGLVAEARAINQWIREKL